jgi:biopolymer transport protein ExbB/TolQ
MNTYGIEQSVSSWYGLLLMGLIAAMSVYLVALAVVRWKFFRTATVDSERLMKDVREALNKNDEDALSRMKGQRASDPPVLILVGAALSNRDMERSELQDMLSNLRIRQRERLNKGLSTFGTMATIAPFLGLLATVLGIIESFHSLAQSGAAGPNVVGSGVAAALWGTAAGLFVAIPAVVAYNVFGRRARSIVTDMDIATRELILLLKMNKSSLARWVAGEERKKA